MRATRASIPTAATTSKVTISLQIAGTAKRALVRTRGIHARFIKDYELSCTLKHVSFSIDSGWEFKYLRGQTIEAPDYLTELYGTYK